MQERPDAHSDELVHRMPTVDEPGTPHSNKVTVLPESARTASESRQVRPAAQLVASGLHSDTQVPTGRVSPPSVKSAHRVDAHIEPIVQ